MQRIHRVISINSNLDFKQNLSVTHQVWCQMLLFTHFSSWQYTPLRSSSPTLNPTNHTFFKAYIVWFFSHFYVLLIILCRINLWGCLPHNIFKVSFTRKDILNQLLFRSSPWKHFRNFVRLKAIESW